jgi:hypothetical protein
MTLQDVTYLNELQDRAMAGDVNAQKDLDTLLEGQQKEESTETKYDHSKRPCTCGSGHTWINCTGLPNGDTNWCG